jgi:uncharacterized flavoprotein (TIGR03862 family)
MPVSSSTHIAIIGAGPAGLMAAEVLSQSGYQVDVYDAMPSVGRKFLLAGIGGLNITHSEPYAAFCQRYTDRQPQLQAMLDQFTPNDLRAWVHALGIETFVGSSGRVFPSEMKAAPLLRAWLQRLRAAGVRVHVRHKWIGWDAQGHLLFTSPEGMQMVHPSCTLLALGGGSWPKLGSDAAWVPLLASKGVQIASLQSANSGFDVRWSAHLQDKFAGAPLKSIALSFTDCEGQTERRLGELALSQTGIEGSLIYAFSQRIRTVLNRDGVATLSIDLLPNHTAERVADEVMHPRGSRSLSSHLQSRLGLTGVKMALLYEVLSREDMAQPDVLAKTIKSLPVTVHATRPLTEAISTAGGVCFESVNADLMLQQLPGVFVAGEMLDWEAPTGGYLLNACFATGSWAGKGMLKWLNNPS